MFVQVIRGRLADPDRARRQLDRWVEELSPGAEGWLGSTGGAADDGRFVEVVRFESEEAARRNSERPEQGEWWAETAACFEGDAAFDESREVDLVMGGGSDDAGFVQVIRGRVSDVDRFRSINARSERLLRERRPDFLGGVVAWHEGGRFTETAYFSSEDAAREGEAKDDPELRGFFEEYLSVLEDAEYLDLRDPWLHSPVLPRP